MAKPPVISEYDFGRIVIDGQTYTSDVIVLPCGVMSGWRPDQGHVLKPEDLSAVLEVSPRVVVIGQGAYSQMRVTDEALACLEEKGIESVCMETPKAVDAYNERCQRGEVVAAALHVTC